MKELSITDVSDFYHWAKTPEKIGKYHKLMLIEKKENGRFWRSENGDVWAVAYENYPFWVIGQPNREQRREITEQFLSSGHSRIYLDVENERWMLTEILCTRSGVADCIERQIDYVFDREHSGTWYIDGEVHRQEDGARLNKWMQDFFASVEDWWMTPADVEELLKQSMQSGAFFCLGEKSNPSSMLYVEEGKTFGEIGYVYTKKECRRKGFAGKLICQTVLRLQKKGLLPVLSVNEKNLEAKNLYESLGFAFCGTRSLYTIDWMKGETQR